MLLSNIAGRCYLNAQAIVVPTDYEKYIISSSGLGHEITLYMYSGPFSTNIDRLFVYFSHKETILKLISVEEDLFTSLFMQSCHLFLLFSTKLSFLFL